MARSHAAAAGPEEKKPKERTVTFSGLNDLLAKQVAEQGVFFSLDENFFPEVQFSPGGMQILNFTRKDRGKYLVLCKDFTVVQDVFKFCDYPSVFQTFLKNSDRLAVFRWFQGSGGRALEARTFEYRGSEKGFCISTHTLPYPPLYVMDDFIALPKENEFEMLASLYSKKENTLILYFMTQDKFMRYTLLPSSDPNIKLTFNKLYFVEPHFLLVHVSTAPDKHRMYRVPLSQLQKAQVNVLEGHSPFVHIPATALTEKGELLVSAFPWCRTFSAGRQLYHANWEEHSCHQVVTCESMSEHSAQLAQGRVPTEHLKDEEISGVFQGMLITTHRVDYEDAVEIYAYNEELTEKQLLGVTEDYYFALCDSAPTKELGILRKVDDEYVLRLMHLPEFKPSSEFKPNQQWVSAVDQAVNKRFPEALLLLIAQYHGGSSGTDMDETSEPAKRRRIEIELKNLNAEESKDPILIQKKMALTELRRLLMPPHNLTVEASVQNMLQHYFKEEHHPDVIAFIVTLASKFLPDYFSRYPGVEYRHAEESSIEEKSKERVIRLGDLQHRVGGVFDLDIQVGKKGMQLLTYSNQQVSSAQAICRNFQFLQNISDLCHAYLKAVLLNKSDKVALLLENKERVQVRTFQYGNASVGLLVSVCNLPNPEVSSVFDDCRLMALPEESGHEMLVSLYSIKEKALVLYFINQDKFVEYKLSLSMKKAKEDKLARPEFEKLLKFKEAYFVEPHFLMVYMELPSSRGRGFMYRVPLSHELLEKAKSLEDFSWAKIPGDFSHEVFSAFPGCSTYLASGFGYALYRVNWESHSCEYEMLDDSEKMRGIFQGVLITTHRKSGEISAYSEDFTKIGVIGKAEEGDEFFDSAATNELGIKTIVDGEYVLRFIRLPKPVPELQFLTALRDAIPENVSRPLVSLIAQYHGGFFVREADEKSNQRATRLSVIERVKNELGKLGSEESKDPILTQKRLAFTELHRLLMLPDKLSVEACVEKMLQNKQFSSEVLDLIIKDFAPNVKRRSAGPGPG